MSLLLCRRNGLQWEAGERYGCGGGKATVSMGISGLFPLRVYLCIREEESKWMQMTFLNSWSELKLT